MNQLSTGTAREAPRTGPPPGRLHDRLHGLLFGLGARAGRRIQQALLRSFFEWKYTTPDPWSYRSSAYEQMKYARTLEAIPDRPYARALEVGCGEGVFSERLARERSVERLLGLDISERAVARARERCAALPCARFQCGDVLDLHPGPELDLVVIAEVLYYLGGATGRLATTLPRRLAPGGLLVLVHPWPRAERLHAPFVGHPALARVSDQVVRHPLRPFRLTVLRRAT